MEEYVEGDPKTGDLFAHKGLSGTDDKTVQVKRGKFDSISLYEVTEEELNTLEVGESSLELNFAIALFSAALTLVVSIFTTQTTDLVLGIFIVCSIMFAILGVYFVVKWKRNKGRVERTFCRIKDRLKD